jgi:hypothetical protein
MLQNADACHILDFKLCNTAKSLKRWSQKFVGSVHLQLAMAKEVVFKLEQAQDWRALSTKGALLQKRAQDEVIRTRLALQNHCMPAVEAHVPPGWRRKY